METSKFLISLFYGSYSIIKKIREFVTVVVIVKNVF